MRRISAALAGGALLALISPAGVAAKPPIGSCPALFDPYPESFFAGPSGQLALDINDNGVVCAFPLPPQTLGGGYYEVIDDVAQVP
jgi:hypothetical protein